jgi:hypothetical protein
MAAEFVRRPVTVVIALDGDVAARAAVAATRTIPGPSPCPRRVEHDDVDIRRVVQRVNGCPGLFGRATWEQLELCGSFRPYTEEGSWSWTL